MSIIDHLPSLTGLALGVLHHGANAATGWLKERQKAGELDKIERVALQRSSYQAWIVHTIVLMFLIAAMMYYHHENDPIASTFQGWAGYGVAWMFGGLVPTISLPSIFKKGKNK